jgi:hypothetical protein
MKTLLNSLVIAALVGMVSCNSSSQSDKQASDTASILDANRNKLSADTNAVDGTLRDTSEAAQSQYEESTGKQSSRTNVGKDTTGMQPHD